MKTLRGSLAKQMLGAVGVAALLGLGGLSAQAQTKTVTVGITLPLVSYGGSSLIAMMAAIGVLISVNTRRYLF